MNYFMLSINVNPSGDRYLDFFAQQVGDVESFKGTSLMKKGDSVVFYVNQQKDIRGGIYGTGVVLEDAQLGLSVDESKEEYRVNVRFSKVSPSHIPLLTVDKLIPEVVGRIMPVQRLKRNTIPIEELFLPF